jgi:hypothetical protein
MILFVLQIAFRCRSVDDALADIDQDAFPLLAIAEGDDMSMIRTHPPRQTYAITIEVTNCGKQLALTSNLSFNVVDV